MGVGFFLEEEMRTHLGRTTKTTSEGKDRVRVKDEWSKVMSGVYYPVLPGSVGVGLVVLLRFFLLRAEVRTSLSLSSI